MSSIDLNELSLIAAQAALKGGVEILDVYKNETALVEKKGDDSPLTQADTRAHQAIMKLLEPTGIPILSEEGKHLPFEERSDWSQLWIVDPLDGTKEFIKRNGEFTVNIALVEDGCPIMGVVYVPVTGELYIGSRGQGAAKLIIESNAIISSEQLSKGEALPKKMEREFTAVGSRSHMNEETETFLETYREKYGVVAILSKGSSLKMCMVAEGLADVYPRFAPTMEWDTAAGQAVVEAAGFSMLEKESRLPLRYNKKDLLNPHFIVL
ncbi:3'(2'),5'-bisphosphate nucleotidase CysQ [Schleiferiaceae bacterium]|nr:3'(2'),5'-bisphosphate nucleotidase [Flavobacteriales bacterium]MDC1022118.1 3'(2'),5'-bisphosphate nucleotidase CysQ [Schleiferiaceae bacterium]